MNEAIKILEFAADLIRTPAQWCKGVSAVDSLGFGVHYYSGDACRWCLTGAISRAAWKLGLEGRIHEVQDALVKTAGSRFRVFWLSSQLNDNLGFEAVYTVLSETIATLRAAA